MHVKYLAESVCLPSGSGNVQWIHYNGGLPCKEIALPNSPVTCVVCHMFVGWSIGLLTPAIHKTGHCCFHKHPELC